MYSHLIFFTALLIGTVPTFALAQILPSSENRQYNAKVNEGSSAADGQNIGAITGGVIAGTTALTGISGAILYGILKSKKASKTTKPTTTQQPVPALIIDSAVPLKEAKKVPPAPHSKPQAAPPQATTATQHLEQKIELSTQHLIPSPEGTNLVPSNKQGTPQSANIINASTKADSVPHKIDTLPSPTQPKPHNLIADAKITTAQTLTDYAKERESQGASKKLVILGETPHGTYDSKEFFTIHAKDFTNVDLHGSQGKFDNVIIDGINLHTISKDSPIIRKVHEALDTFGEIQITDRGYRTEKAAPKGATPVSHDKALESWRIYKDLNGQHVIVINEKSERFQNTEDPVARRSERDAAHSEAEAYISKTNKKAIKDKLKGTGLKFDFTREPALKELHFKPQPGERPNHISSNFQIHFAKKVPRLEA